MLSIWQSFDVVLHGEVSMFLIVEAPKLIGFSSAPLDTLCPFFFFFLSCYLPDSPVHLEQSKGPAHLKTRSMRVLCLVVFSDEQFMIISVGTR